MPSTLIVRASMPKPGSFLLDTNIVIGLLGGEAAIGVRVAHQAQVYLPSIVLGELYYGAHRSRQPRLNIKRIDALASDAAVVACDRVSAERYGRLKADLRSKGTPIPENDLWIASLAVRHDMTLVTRDAHFRAVTGLTTESWAE